MNKNILALMPVFIFMIIMLIVSIYVRRASAKRTSEGFVKDYFIGSRSLRKSQSKDPHQHPLGDIQTHRHIATG